MAQKVHELREAMPVDNTAQYEQVWEHKRLERDSKFEVHDLGGGVFRVEGKAVERAVIQCDWDNDEAITYLQRRLRGMGVDAALHKAGAASGDEIRILGRSFEYEGSEWEDDEDDGYDGYDAGDGCGLGDAENDDDHEDPEVEWVYTK